MKKTVVILWIAAGIAALGIVFLVIGLATNHWSLSPFLFVPTETAVLSDPSAIVLETDAAAVEVTHRRVAAASVSYPDGEGFTAELDERDGTISLRVRRTDTAFFTLYTPKITLVLPLPLAPRLEIRCTAGAVDVEGNFASVSITADAGAVELEDCTAAEIDVRTQAGGILLSDLRADRISAIAGTGAVRGEELTANSLFLQADTGRIWAEELAAPRIEAATGTGSIHLEIEGRKSLYTIETAIGTGSSNVVDQIGLSDRLLRISTDVGSVHVDWED